MTLRLYAMAAAGVVVMSGGAAAKDAASEAYQGFKAETIAAIFTELGAKELASSTIDNEPRLTFKVGDYIYAVDFYDCEDKAKGCKAMLFLSSYVAQPTDTVQAVNSYNASYAFGKAAIEKDGGLSSMRPVIGEFGSSKAHVLSEWQSYLSMTEVLFEHLNKNVVARNSGGAAPAYLNTAAPRQRAYRRSRFGPAAKRVYR